MVVRRMWLLHAPCATDPQLSVWASMLFNGGNLRAFVSRAWDGQSLRSFDPKIAYIRPSLLPVCHHDFTHLTRLTETPLADDGDWHRVDYHDDSCLPLIGKTLGMYKACGFWRVDGSGLPGMDTIAIVGDRVRWRVLSRRVRCPTSQNIWYVFAMIDWQIVLLFRLSYAKKYYSGCFCLC